MQAREGRARNPNGRNFRILKRVVEVLDHSRRQCGCLSCVGSPYGDISASGACDGAIEAAADNLANERAPR